MAPVVPVPLRTFYVDAANGSDAANGTSPTTPWRTLGQANQTVQPGDLVLLGGTFLDQVIHPGTSGTTMAPIVYRVWPGATAALDGGQSGVMVWLDGLSNIVVDGLELRNVANAVTLNSGATHNWLRNLQIHDLASEAVQIVGGSDNRLENSNIQRCGDAATNSGDCIWIADNANRNVVVRNTISYGGHGAIDIGGDRTPLQPSYDNVVALNDVANPWASNLLLQGYARRAIVECNRLHSASTTGINYPRTGMYITADSNIVRYNELFGNTADGIEIAGYNFQGFVEHARGNWVYNNTFWGNGGAGIEMFQGDVAQVSDNVIENNILWGNNVASNATVARYQNGSYWDIWVDLYHANTVWPDGSLNGNVLRNNLAAKDAANIGQGWLYIVTPTTDRSYTLAQAQASLPNVAGNLQADPQFVNPGSFDFRLQATSPAIDAGLVIPGIPYLGTAPDLGAHEMR